MIILDNKKIKKLINDESGFQFHKVLKQETETQQDCLCSLARHIVHTERSFQQFQVHKQLWNIKRNQGIRKDKEDAKRDEIINKGISLDMAFTKKNQQYNSASESLDRENELGFNLSASELCDSAGDAENIQNNPLIFVDFKLMKI